jgi:RNA polymerase sigma-B factor
VGRGTELRLFRRYRDDRDEHAKERLVERFIPLAHWLARRYAWGREPMDDLVQVACVGLMKSIERFDPDRGVAFSTYAVPTIAGELRRHLRDTSWSVHVSQRVRQRVLDVTRATDELRGLLGRSPTADEVAQAIGESVECVAEAAEAASAYEATSLDLAPDRRTFEDDGFDLVEYGAILEPALGALPDRERVILRLRFDLDLTQSEIAKTLGMSQMHVSRLLRRSLERLRTVAAHAA